MPVRMPCTTLPIAFGSIAKEWFGDEHNDRRDGGWQDYALPAARASEGFTMRYLLLCGRINAFPDDPCDRFRS
jgi:hypothetical protein